MNNSPEQQQPSPKTYKPSTLLLSVLECIGDGVMLVDRSGQILYSNQSAQEMIRLLPKPASQALPDVIWTTCESVIDSHKLFEGKIIILEAETDNLRIRVQWMDLDSYPDHCLLVRLENRQQALYCLAEAEAKSFGLTLREAEVWKMKRLGHSRKEIAQTLYISIDTVKKHLCNIQTKRQAQLLELCA
jgi:DNA-binding CsgD family transcriptional regulator